MIKQFESFLNENISYKKTGFGIKVSDLFDKYGCGYELVEYLNENYIGKSIILESSDQHMQHAILINIKKFVKNYYTFSSSITAHSERLYINNRIDKEPECSLTINDTMTEIEEKEIIRKFTLEDPYGEEDWEENESKVNESDLSNNYLRGQEGWIYFRFKTMDEMIEFLNFFHDMGFKWNSGRSLTNYIPDNVTYLKANMKYMVIYGTATEFIPHFADLLITLDEFKHNYNEYLKDYDKLIEDNKRKREEIKSLHKEDDPYGEEDWMSESLENYKNIMVPNLNKYNGTDDITRVKSLERTFSNRIAKCNVKFKTPWGETKEGKVTGIRFTSYTRDNEIIEYPSNLIIRKSRIKIYLDDGSDHNVVIGSRMQIKEPIRRISSNDPYGEENWEENESKVNETIDFQVVDTFNGSVYSGLYEFIRLGEWYRVTKAVWKHGKEKKLLLFKKDISWQEKESRIIKIKDVSDDWGECYLIFNQEYKDGEIIKHKFDTSISFYNETNVTVERLINPDYVKPNIEVDPYGEEDWENESMLNENLSLEILSSPDGWIYIKLNNKNYVIEFLGYFEHLGFKWNGGQKPTYYYPSTKCIKVNLEHKIIFGTDMETFDFKSKMITLDEFKLKYKNYINDIEKEKLEKYKRSEELKLKMKDVDPWGEEDWLIESKKNKIRRITMPDVDPYGEEDWGWDTKINDEDFKGKYIIYKNSWPRFSNTYNYAILYSHYQVVSTFTGDPISLNDLRKYSGLTPLTNREVERIKNDKIGLMPLRGNPRNDLGEILRKTYSSLGKDCLFLDQYYDEHYLFDE